MKILRITIWMGDEPMMTMNAERDLIVSPEEALQRSLAAQPYAFFTHDIFEMDGDPHISEIAAEVSRRLHLDDEGEPREQNERNMAILYQSVIESWSEWSEGYRVLVGSDPAPLSEANIREVFDRLKVHPEYKGFSFTAMARDGTVVRS